MCPDHCATPLLHQPDPHLPFPTKGQLVGRTARTGTGLASTVASGAGADEQGPFTHQGAWSL